MAAPREPRTVEFDSTWVRVENNAVTSNQWHNRPVSHSRFLALCVACSQAYSLDASACGDTPMVLLPLLPQADATEQPLDVVLIASANKMAVTFSLRALSAASGRRLRLARTQGKRATPVQRQSLTIDCHWGLQGALCTGAPVALLEPDTTYEWSATMVAPPGVGPAEFGTPAIQRFKTADAAFPTVTRDIVFDVQEHHRFTEPLCGLESSAILRFYDPALSSPVVVNVKGVTPSYVAQPRVLPGTPALLDLTLDSPPDCVMPEFYYPNGMRIEGPEICLEEALPATEVDQDGLPVASSQPNSAPTAESPAGVPDDSDASPSESESEEESSASEDDVDAADLEDGVRLRPVEDAGHDGCSMGVVPMAGERVPGSCITLLSAIAAFFGLSAMRRRDRPHRLG